MIKYYLFICVLFFGKLNAEEQKLTNKRDDEFTHLPRLIKKNNWDKLSRYIDNKKHIPLSKLGKIANSENSQPLARAVDTVKVLRESQINFHMPKRKLFKTALFLETGLSNYIKSNQNYIPSKISKLPFAVEVDPENKNRFILFDKKLGSGFRKVVTLGALCNGKKTQIIARGTQKETDLTTDYIDREMSVSRKFRSSPGVVSNKGITKTVVNGENLGDEKRHLNVYSSFLLNI